MRRIVTVIVLLACAVLIAVLVRQNGVLARKLGRAQARAVLPHEGLMLPSIQASTLEGKKALVGEKLDGGRQVLLVFTTTCPSCKASIPAFQAISDSLKRQTSSGRVQLLGVSLDPVEPTIAYRDAHRLSFPIVLFKKKDPVVFRLRAVPLVLVLDSVGQVKYSRFGEITTPTAIDSVIDAAQMEGTGRLTLRQ